MAEVGEDTFLSDVHIGTYSSISHQGTTISRFVFTLPQLESLAEEPSAAAVDSDGDFVVQRRPHHTLMLEHAMSTVLSEVGLQVWRGSLLMVDYLLWLEEGLRGSVVLELGAGTGLVSLVAALKAQHVLCTDTGQKLLKLCQKNIDSNVSEIEGCCAISVRELDWSRPLANTSDDKQKLRFCWSSKDMEMIGNISLIIACDVIYDDLLTDHFFSCLLHLLTLTHRQPKVLVALEKRINFSLDELLPVSTHHQYFRQCLQSTYTTTSGDQLRFHAQEIDIDFPQCFPYDRVKELELWVITGSVEEL